MNENNNHHIPILSQYEYHMIKDDVNNNADTTTDNNETKVDIIITMILILGTLLLIVIGLISIQIKVPVLTTKTETTTTTTTTELHNKQQKQQQQPSKDKMVVKSGTTNDKNEMTSRTSTSTTTSSRYLPDPLLEPSKYSYELYIAYYTPIWMMCFGMIILFQWYEQFTAHMYWIVCGSLTLPLVLQPIFYPQGIGISPSPDMYRPIHERYCTKANVWIIVYSIIGNYWYTHYFYSVLKASYTMPSHRLNNVPIAMYMATYYYFSSYHFFSNCLLRKIETSYVPSLQRKILFITTILVVAYGTAFLETLTISSYPYYQFEDRYMAYTVGSAFYGIYFLVSFPAFYYFDSNVDAHQQSNNTNKSSMTLWETIVSSCGYGMMIMFLLDFVRLYLDIPLIVGGNSTFLLQSQQQCNVMGSDS